MINQAVEDVIAELYARKKIIKIIIDTNLFISFLIGKRLKGLKDSLVHSTVELVFSEHNIEELKIVTSGTVYFEPHAGLINLKSIFRQ